MQTIYTQFIYDGHWSIDDVLQQDLVAGMLLALSLIKKEGTVRLINLTGENRIINDFKNNFILDKYRKYPSESYGWEIVDNFYSFNFPNFVRGFISIMAHYKKDFRDYIENPPFKLVNNVKNYYNIEGYDIKVKTKPIEKNKQIAFFTNVYGTD